MSKFGKKAINFWDWDAYMKEKEIFKRWNGTPKETQLELLKKWYPIGMIGREIHLGSNKPSDLKVVEITGYIEYISGYHLEVSWNVIYKKFSCHPVRFIPEQGEKNKILRELRLSRLLG